MKENNQETSQFQVPERRPLPEMEQGVSTFWDENQIFQKSIEQRSEDNRYVFIDGPPFVSGSVHYGHLIVSIAKDMIPRYWTMKGKRVRRVWGWDCHGLPVEAKVNQKFNIKSSKQVEDSFGVEKYVAECREFVNEQMTDWRWYIDRVGRWADIDNAYKTMDPDFGESVVWAFKQMYEQGLIYKGKRTSLYSTDTSTPVSEFEVAMDPDNYQEVEDLSVYVKFSAMTDRFDSETGGAPVHLIAWTTTPWTLPSNFALAVNPDFTYVLARIEDEFVLMAQDLMTSVVGNEQARVVTTIPGTELVGIEYQPLFNYFVDKTSTNDFHVYASNEVTNTEGTGILHVAPAFGDLDFRLGQENELSDYLCIDDEGKMTVGAWDGVYLRDASSKITEDLKERGVLYRSELYTHRLPFYRGDNPLIYMTQDAYFIDLTKVNERMLALNEDVNWIPETLKHGRFKHTVETAPDWCISRNRYWGTIMPIWKSETGEELVIGSISEMMEYTDRIQEKEIDGKITYVIDDKELSFHRDVLDSLVLTRDGVEYHRVPEILDVWLDSGSVPFAEYHYPFENEALFKKGFPADFVIEYTGQIRAWFQVLFRVSTMLFDEAPFKNVVAYGVLAGTDGRKMSKTYGNYPDPREVLETLGGDALRLYFMSSPMMLGENTAFNETDLQNKVKGVLNIYWNTALYFFTYASEHGFEPSDMTLKHPMDQWVVARFNKTVELFEQHIQIYEIPPAVRAVESFIDDLSTWYVRQSRDRISTGDTAALATLYNVLLSSTKAFAPLMPFLTETIYQHLSEGELSVFKESVHLEDYPEIFTNTVNEDELLEAMEVVRGIASVAHALRKQEGLPVRQPLALLEVETDNDLSQELLSILEDELNIKSVVCVSSLTNDSWVMGELNGMRIALDVVLTPELELEGTYRTLTRKIQNMRKKAGLVVSDRITLTLEDTDESRAIVGSFGQDLREKVGADEIIFGAETHIESTT